MMIRPCKPRDSARPALLTAVRNRRSGLALHPPEGYYTAFTAPDWRGGIRVGRTSWLTRGAVVRPADR